jgi:hypothetical protein
VKAIASQIISWLEILDYIGSMREMEESTSFPIGLPWDRMKPLGSHMTTERTNRRQGVYKALKGGVSAGLGKRQGENVRVCWAGNKHVRERGQVSESQAYSRG